MGCGNCSSGGCSSGVPNGCNNNGACGTGGCNKLSVFDWLSGMELPSGQQPFEYVEVRFKNGRKEFFSRNGLSLNAGDVVAVESSPGHDIGVVSLSGELVKIQMRKKQSFVGSPETKKVYRLARQPDIDLWHEARSLEFDTMKKAREMAIELKLSMKISDVEYQGDKTKAIFYYTAEERVDFRELIKRMADEFKVRIEMKQIGMRQEASRLGGIGSCGRELCCSTWLTDFRSVSTTAARYQQLSINPMKLAGQCGKLKCCLNYELDVYTDALKEFPDTEKKLKTKKGTAFFQKMDVFKKLLWYSYDEDPFQFIELSLERVNQIVAENKKGNLPEELKDFSSALVKAKKPVFENVVGQDSLTRFDNKGGKKKKRKGGNKNYRKGKKKNSKPSNNSPKQ